jgi:large-conductance mechanosensitive channel
MQDRASTLTAVAAVFLILTLLILPARFAARHASRTQGTRAARSGIGIDDWTALVAGIGSSLGCCIIFVARHRGLGRHVDVGKLPVAARAMRLVFVAQIIYLVVMALTKTATLLLYTRIADFRSETHKHFRRCCYAVMGITWLTTALLLGFSITSCTPTSHFWTRLTNFQHDKSCSNPKGLLYSNTLISIILDSIVVALPVWLVVRLQMSLRQKLLISGLFALGGV